MARRVPELLPLDVATAAYQVEGALEAGRQGGSIWDTFGPLPGNIKNDENGDIANDHYHGCKDDVALMKTIGANACRCSIAWLRIRRCCITQYVAIAVDRPAGRVPRLF